MKLRGALLLVAVATVCALSGLISPHEAAASVDVVNQWPAKPTIVSNSNTAAVSGSFTVAPGTKRLMLVAVAFESTTAPTVAVTYGGQALTQIVLNTTGANKLWLGRLNEAGIVAAGANKALSVTLTGAGTITATYVTAAVYAGVDQTTPVIGSGSLGTTATALTIGPVGYTPSVSAIDGNNGLSVYLVNWNNTNVGQTTPATGFTEVRDYIGTNFSLSANYKVKTGATAESITSTTTTSAIAALAAVTLNPAAGAGALSVATVTTCGDCHGYPPQDGAYVTARNTPPGQFPGAHSKHSGTDEGQYAMVCTVCHKDNGTDLKHENGFKNITGSGVPRNTYGGATNIPMTDTTYTETCTKSTCHSSGRTTRQYAASPIWSGTTTCLSCHGGRNSGTGAASRSANNFSMSTSHSQHLKYLSTEINCQLCHGKTAANHTTLKEYSGAKYHGNGSKNVLFNNIAYGSYTSYKSSASGSIGTTKTCNNTSCHGGQSRSGWAENTAVNSNHTCAHCHGIANTPTGNTDRRAYAPGYRKTGTSTDQKTNKSDMRVGAHFVHLSSAYMKNIKCNECHKVPSTPFQPADTNHSLNTLRYNSGTLDFAQSSSARIAIGVSSGSTPAQLAAFAGYTNGTATKAATCSSVYCHGNRLKTSDAGGTPNNTYRKPYWNYSGMVRYSDPAIACGRCHGNPPSSVSASHNGVTPTTGCSGCHSTVVNATGQIINKTLHINGQVDASSHPFPYTGGSPQHKIDAGTTWTNCSGCHTTTGTGTMTAYATWVSTGHPSKTAPNCSVCHIGGLANNSCSQCHGASANNGTALAGMPGVAGSNVFPNISGSHRAHMTKISGAPIVCSNCHGGFGSGSTKHGFYNTTTTTKAKIAKTTGDGRLNFATISGAGTASNRHIPVWVPATNSCNNTCHGNGAVWGGRLQCIDCHGAVITRTVGTYAGKTLMAVKNEFGLSYGHKKTGRTAVTGADCVVCHLEGVGGTSNTSATYHKNGTIDLRDPDVAGDTPITNLTGGAFTFGRFSTSFAAGSRSSAPAANNIAQVISIKFCLKCHDSNGAQNTTARVSGGTAWMPWGGSTGYAAQTGTNLNGVPVANGLVNVFSQFSSANSSLHPVRAPRTKDFPTPARMVAPYNGFTRVGTAGTTTQGVVLNCFDCHNNYPTLNYLGKTGLLTLRTNAAHGTSGVAASGGMMRGVFYSTNNTLCSACHSGYTVTGQHGAGSAMASNTGRTDEGFNNNCMNCHGSKTTAPTTAPARPIAAADFHGSNNRITGTLWPTINARPVAFIRGWSGTAYHRGRALAGTSGYAAGTAQCGSGTCPTGGTVGDGSNRNYIPGGTY